MVSDNYARPMLLDPTGPDMTNSPTVVGNDVPAPPTYPRVDRGRAAHLSVSLVAFLTCYTVVATFGGAYVLQDGDTFWHVRVGTWILDNAQLPTVDIFSYTALGHPWIATDWLSEVLLATAYRLGKLGAGGDLAALSFAAITGILCVYF